MTKLSISLRRSISLKLFGPSTLTSRCIAIFLGLVLQVFTNPALAKNDTEQLIYNADMEEASPSGGVAGWAFDNWAIDEQGNKATFDESVFHSGKASVKIKLVQGDDGKVVQEINVKPNTWYRFAAWVKTEDVSQKDQVGANLSVINGMDYSAEVKGNSDWQELEAWGQTGPEQTTLKIAVRLGFYGSLATGTAWFDDASLTQSEPPAGSKIINFISHSTPPSDDGPASAALTISIAIGVTCLFLLFAWCVIRERDFLHRHLGAIIDSYIPLTKTWPVFVLIIFIIVLKVIGSVIIDGYPADVSTFSAWAFDIYEHGFSGFYRPGYLADYPPGYMAVLWLIGGMSNWFGINYGTPEFLILLKTPAMLADIIGVIFLLKIAHQNTAARPWALVAALLWLINPLAFITSSFWGQVDSIFTLFLACSLLMLERRRIALAAGLYAIAILLKPQALMIAPIAMIALLLLRDIRLQLKAVGAFVATFILVSLPFTIFHEPLWIFKLYGSTLSSYNYLTLNAFNLYSLLGQNWLPCETLLMGMQVSTWAWLLTLTVLATILSGLVISERKQHNIGSYLFVGFAIFLVCFVICPKIHERYLFPAAFIGFAAFAVIGDKRILWLAIGTSLTTFINTLVTLDFMLRLQSSLVPNDNFFMIVCSVANIIMLIQTMRVGYDIFLRGNIRQLADKTPVATTTITTFTLPAEQFTKVTRNTWLALAGICVAYGIAAFIYLGNFESPQKFWNPKTAEGSAVFDLGEVKTVNRLQYHHGLGTGEYAFSWSQDGQDWKSGQGIIVDNRFAEFRWRSIHINQSARYFKIGLSTGLLQMNELALRDTKDELIIPKQVSGPDGASALFDEPEKTATISTAFNGMYFDEIYHARSAWEILQGIDASENTHPPLGKIIIGVGIKIFGMNAFGFRVMGVLFGILMLPVFFCLARRLFNSDKFALVATALLAVDFMHFTQTRIATIDTYGVFFILASTYWMLRFMQSEPQNKNWNTDVKSLLLCGTLFGLGIASKWIVIYHGVGLAGLYCWMLWRQTKVSSAHAINSSDYNYNHQSNSGYNKWLIQTLAVSVIAFLIIPALIYTAAYIPLMKDSGQGFSGMIANQTGMWDYHSNMKSTHPSSSPWYTWPIMSMPVWYYSGGEWTGPAKVSSIMAFGNPLVWYLGTIAFVLAFAWRIVLVNSKNIVQKFQVAENQTLILGFILICGLTQFLPWALIPRKLVFIYHFFASVPFIILALVWGLQRFEIYNPARIWIRYLPWGLVAIAAALFIAYFPVISGLPVPRTWPEFINYGPVDLFF